MTRIPGSINLSANYFAFVDQEQDVFFCGTLLLSQDTCTRVIFTSSSIKLKFSEIDYLTSTSTKCVATGYKEGSTLQRVFIIDCSCPEPTPIAEFTRLVENSDFLYHGTTERPMAFAISQKSQGLSQNIIVYVRMNSLDYIFATDYGSVQKQPTLFQQREQHFTEAKI